MPMNFIDDPERYRAPSLEKGLDVLEVLARSAEPMTATQIAAGLNRSLNELFRIVQVLEHAGFIASVQDRRGYFLTGKLFALGLGRTPTRDLIRAGLPHMRELARSIGQSCHLGVRSGDKVVTIARVESPGHSGYSVRPGHSRDIVEATSGVVLYAFQPAHILAEWASDLLTTMPKARARRFLQKVRLAREIGVCEAATDLTPGVIDLSTAVMGHTGAVAALTIPYIVNGDAEPLEEARDAVRRTASCISGDLNGRI